MTSSGARRSPKSRHHMATASARSAAGRPRSPDADGAHPQARAAVPGGQPGRLRPGVPGVHLGAGPPRAGGLPDGGGLNIGYEAVDRHARGTARATRRAALRRPGRRRPRRHLRGAAPRRPPVRQRARPSSGSARATGCSRCWAAVPSCTSRCWARSKTRSVLSPAVLGVRPRAGAERMRLGEATVLVTTPSCTGGRSRRSATGSPTCAHVLLVTRRPRTCPAPSTSHALMAAAPDDLHRSPPTDPRGHGAAALHQRHHRARRRARCTSTRPWSPTTPPPRTPSTCVPTTSSGAPPTPAGSPACRTGSSPRWCIGATVVVDEGEFDARRWYRTSTEQRVTVWYTAPTALRMLMRRGAEEAAAPRPVGAALRRQRRRTTQPRGRACGAPRCWAGRCTTTGGRPRPAPS